LVGESRRRWENPHFYGKLKISYSPIWLIISPKGFFVLPWIIFFYITFFTIQSCTKTRSFKIFDKKIKQSKAIRLVTISNFAIFGPFEAKITRNNFFFGFFPISRFSAPKVVLKPEVLKYSPKNGKKQISQEFMLYMCNISDQCVLLSAVYQVFLTAVSEQSIFPSAVFYYF